MIATVAGYVGMRPLDWSAASVGTPASTTETVLKSYSIPAAMLNVNGKRIRAQFWGTFAATGNNKTLRVRLGPVTITGTAIFTSQTTAFNAETWRIQVDIVRRIADGQSPIVVLQTSSLVAGRISDAEITAAANDDDAAMLLELTGQNAVAAANDITAEGHIVEWYAQP